MNIRRATPADHDTLLDIWLRSVRATHDFVSPADLEGSIPLVRKHLAAEGADVWVACDDGGAVMGFMGMSGSQVDMLFLAPEHFRRGVGRRLVEHARSLHGDLTADVNEQNSAARQFYEACGFVVEGRSELDGTGRPYPLLHMRLVERDRAQQRATPQADAAAGVAGRTFERGR